MLRLNAQSALLEIAQTAPKAPATFSSYQKLIQIGKNPRIGQCFCAQKAVSSAWLLTVNYLLAGPAFALQLARDLVGFAGRNPNICHLFAVTDLMHFNAGAKKLMRQRFVRL